MSQGGRYGGQVQGQRLELREWAEERKEGGATKSEERAGQTLQLLQ